MDFNEEFDKIWKKALDEYETIPDKSKIKNEDREFARGYFWCLYMLENVIDNYKDELEPGFESFDKIVDEVATNYDSYVKDSLRMDLDELITSILDGYVE